MALNKETKPITFLTNKLDCDILVSEVNLSSCYYIQIQTNTLKKDPFIPRAMG